MISGISPGRGGGVGGNTVLQIRIRLLDFHPGSHVVVGGDTAGLVMAARPALS